MKPESAEPPPPHAATVAHSKDARTKAAKARVFMRFGFAETVMNALG